MATGSTKKKTNKAIPHVVYLASNDHPDILVDSLGQLSDCSVTYSSLEEMTADAVRDDAAFFGSGHLGYAYKITIERVGELAKTVKVKPLESE